MLSPLQSLTIFTSFKASENTDHKIIVHNCENERRTTENKLSYTTQLLYISVSLVKY